MWTKTMYFQGQLLKSNTLSKILSLMFLHIIVIINYKNENFKETDEEECHEKSVTVIHEKPGETCEIQPTKVCKYVITNKILDICN